MIHPTPDSWMWSRSRHAIETVRGSVISSCGTGARDGLMSARIGTDTIAKPTPTTPWTAAAKNVTMRAVISAAADMCGNDRGTWTHA